MPKAERNSPRASDASKQADGSARHNRSRKGCYECRKRRIACDENKPHCHKCLKKNLECRYVMRLKFREDLESKGSAFGREGVWSKGGPNNLITSNDLTLLAQAHQYLEVLNFDGNYHFINISSRDLSALTQHWKPQLLPSINLHYSDHCIDQDSTTLALSYYLNYILPIFSPTNSLTSIKCQRALDFSTIVQYSQMGNSHIFYLILAIGSRYLMRHDEGHWSSQSVKFKKIAIKKIRKNLHNGEFENHAVSKVHDLLLSTLLLCLYDIADDCNDDWSKHLAMANTLIMESGNISKNDFESEIMKFSREFFSYQEAMGRTACKKLSLFNSDDWKDDEGIVTWMGCNKDLVSIISDITDLTYERANPISTISTSKYKSLTTVIERRIKNSQRLNTEDDLIPTQESEEFYFLLGCECKRLATLLYHYCALLNKNPREVSDIVNKLSRYLKFIILDKCYHWSFLLWPTFMMASQINPFDSNSELLRSLTLDLLNYLELNTLGNVNKTREIILNIWKNRDFSNVEYKRKPTNEIIGVMNDWEYFVANTSYNISLA